MNGSLDLLDASVSDPAGGCPAAATVQTDIRLETHDLRCAQTKLHQEVYLELVRVKTEYDHLRNAAGPSMSPESADFWRQATAILEGTCNYFHPIVRNASEASERLGLVIRTFETIDGDSAGIYGRIFNAWSDTLKDNPDFWAFLALQMPVAEMDRYLMYGQLLNGEGLKERLIGLSLLLAPAMMTRFEGMKLFVQDPYGLGLWTAAQNGRRKILLPYGAQVEYLGKTKISREGDEWYRWYYVRAVSGATGWIRGEKIDVSGAVEESYILVQNPSQHRRNGSGIELPLRKKWNVFSAEGVVLHDHTPPPYGDSQYLDLRNLLGEGFPSKHWSLCGEISVLEAVGEVNLMDGIGRFAELPKMNGQSGLEILRNARSGTDAGKLRAFLESYGFGSLYYRVPSSGQAPTPDAFYDALQDGGDLVVLANLNVPSGQLMPFDPDSGARQVGHWVGIKDMWRDLAGQAWVEVYNPLHNRYEAYKWETLAAAMKKPGRENQEYYTYLDLVPPGTQIQP